MKLIVSILLSVITVVTLHASIDILDIQSSQIGSNNGAIRLSITGSAGPFDIRLTDESGAISHSVDGVSQMAVLAFDGTNLLLAWSPVLPGGGVNGAYYSVEAEMIRQQTRQFMVFLVQVRYIPRVREEVKMMFSIAIAKWFGEITDVDCQAQYLQGKLALDIVDLVVGSHGFRATAANSGELVGDVAVVMRRLLNSLEESWLNKIDGIEVRRVDDVIEIFARNCPKNSAGCRIGVIEEDGVFRIAFGELSKEILNIDVIKKLRAIEPGDFTGTSLASAFGTTLCFNKDDVWKHGMRIKFEGVTGPDGFRIKQLIDEIRGPRPNEPVPNDVKFGDKLGKKKEEIADLIFTSPRNADGNRIWNAVNGMFKDGSGFDGLYIRRGPDGKINGVIINESKGFYGSINMKNVDARGGFDQMSRNWINRVFDDLIKEEPDNVDVDLIEEIVGYLGTKNGSADKVITSLDKKTGEVIILNYGVHK